MPRHRIRLAVALVSLAVIGVELALMRSLSLRYGQHVAYLVIRVALLGFGASGTVLALAGRVWEAWRREAMAGSALLFALAVPAARWLARAVPLDVQYLSWDLAQVVYVGLLQVLLFVPFLFAGVVVGLALTDEPGRIGGHYAANLAGSGLGAVAAVLLMDVVPLEDLFIMMAGVALAAGAVAMPWYRAGGVAAVLLAAIGLVHLTALAPAGSRIILHDEGLLGRPDAVSGPAQSAALAQSLVLAAGLILLPFARRADAFRGAPRKAVCLTYFLLVGLGSVALAMAFLGRLTLFVGVPLYGSAAVIASFLVFGGIGSLLSQVWRLSPRQVASASAAAVLAIGATYLLRLDAWLADTQGEAMPVRFLVAAGLIAPLAVTMGHLFPSGLRQVGLAAPAVVPWAWGAGGVASVMATVATPLVAMHVGVARAGLVALGCYAAAGVLAWWLPERRPRPTPVSRPAGDDHEVVGPAEEPAGGGYQADPQP